jgi:multiple sugar transport system ATP-binding protein
MGIRPEDITIDTEPSPHNVPVTVILLQPVGADTYVSMSVGEATLTARSSPDRNFRVDDQVFANLNSQRIHFFDKSSGHVVR